MRLHKLSSLRNPTFIYHLQSFCEMEFLVTTLSCISNLAFGGVNLSFWWSVPSFLKNYGVIRSLAFGLYLLFLFDVFIISHRKGNVNNYFEFL